MSTVKPSSWRSPLGEEIQRYVLYKRALGHRYLIEESALCMLDRFLCERRVDCWRLRKTADKWRTVESASCDHRCR